MLVVLVCLVFVCECFGKDSWDGTFQSRRFSQKFRVRESIITAETEVTVNSAPSRVWQELQGPWDWWIDGTGVVASDDGSRLLGVSSMFSGNVRLQPFDSLMRFEGNVSGVIQGQMTLAVRPHCCIPWRSVVHVSIKGVRNSWLLTDAQLARSLLWAFRGELSWYPHVRGLQGLVRRLEGAVSARHDIIEDSQLDSFVRSKESTLLWASLLDTSAALDDHPSIPAKRELDLARVFRQPSGSGDNVFLQFALNVEEEGDREGGWSTRGRVKIDLIGPDSRLSFVLDDSAKLSLRLPSLVDDSESVVVARLRPAPPGVPHLVSVIFSPNWTFQVQVDDEQPFVATVPPRLRDETALEHLSTIELRSSMRATLHHLLVTLDPNVAAEVKYFSSRRIAVLNDAHSLGDSASNSERVSLSWTSLFVAMALLVGGPLLVARLATFDSGLIPKKGLADKPLLYFRLAPSAFLTHSAVAACAVLCLLLSIFLQATWIPSVIFALTAHPTISIIWRIAACALTMQRITEAYLGFKTYIDKLTEKSFRVAFPLFNFQYWLYMNRVSLISHVLESLSLLIVSLTAPNKSGNLQMLAWILFHSFHLLHVVSHFQTFNELKRSYHSGLVVSLRHVLNAAVVTVLMTVLFWLAFALTGVSGLNVASLVCDWLFFGVTFVWHYMVQREFIAPEDTRLYVGRRVALGASVRCSECLRPFSKSRTRETCADCRDECCIECGAEVHLAELGSLVDMSLFCCSKCHKLLLAEVSAARARALMRTTANQSSADGAAEVCRMFQRGECSYGASCRYLHVRIRSASRHKPAAPSKTSTATAPASAPAPAPAPVNLVVSPVPSSDVDSLIESDTNSMLDSSSGIDSLSSIEKKKRRRGKRGQRKKKGQMSESDGFDELMMQEADVNEVEDAEKDH